MPPPLRSGLADGLFEPLAQMYCRRLQSGAVSETSRCSSLSCPWCREASQMELVAEPLLVALHAGSMYVYRFNLIYGPPQAKKTQPHWEKRPNCRNSRAFWKRTKSRYSGRRAPKPVKIENWVQEPQTRKTRTKKKGPPEKGSPRPWFSHFLVFLVWGPSA